MKYISTRDGSLSFTFEEAICSGYAPDGGLYVPCSLPSIDAHTIKQWAKLSYPLLAAQVLRYFISPDEISEADLEKICYSSFGDCFPQDPVPVRQIGTGGGFIAELFHGPTFCFKDFGMRFLIFLLSYFASKRARRITLLVSTTGDTGPAAVQAVSDAANPLLTILVHYPEGQISSFQRKQLTTVRSSCVHVASFEGGGDDMDSPIKQLLSSSSSTSNHILCGINSYNIGRPLAQMIHFIWIYCRVMDQLDTEWRSSDPESCDPFMKTIDIILPTGAMGNIAGGYLAKKIGIPLGMLCAAVNINDVTYRVIETGTFQKSPQMLKTLSEAINIQVPYNFERILFYLSNQKHEVIRNSMVSLSEMGSYDLELDSYSKLREEFASTRITDEEMCSAMSYMYYNHQYLADPHTAVAIAGAKKLGYTYDLQQNLQTFVVLATASPCKFQEAVTAALGKEVWSRYFETDFPIGAKKLLVDEEILPSCYRNDGRSLSDVQKDWEIMAMNIITKYFS